MWDINSHSALIVGWHALGFIFGFFVLKGFTYSTRYISLDIDKVGGDGDLLPVDSGVGVCFGDWLFVLTLITVGVRGGTLAGRRFPLKAFRTDGSRRDIVNDERVEAVPSEREYS
jgi:hypothetical protein